MNTPFTLSRGSRSRHGARPFVAAAAACILLGGCSEREAERGRAHPADGPTPVLAWRFTVREDDSVFITSPGDFAVDPDDGSFYIADRFTGRVAHVDRTGGIRGFFGRKGRGPGEFAQVSLMFVRGRDLLVNDAATEQFSVFDRRTREFREQRRHPGVFYGIRLEGSTAWMGMLNAGRGTAVARWNLQTDSLHYMVALPREYRESPPLAGIYNGSFVVPWADTLLVALQGSSTVHLHAPDGRPIDSVRVPAVARRGVPDDIVQRFKTMSYPEMFSAASGVFALQRLADGKVAVVHFDQEAQGSLITARAFVSVLSADRRRACVDGTLPVSTDTQPAVLFRGDTLVVMQQRLSADDRAETSIAGYLLDTCGCRWRLSE